MPTAGTHYETAFKAWLTAGAWHFVALDQARKAVLAGQAIKSFDLIIYPHQHSSILCDIKGRKLSCKSFNRCGPGESWATRQDVEGLVHWQRIFGSDYLAAFVFAYWLYDFPENPAEPLKDVFLCNQKAYAFYVIELNAYRLKMRDRSPRWQTVYVPSSPFRELAQPVSYFLNRTA